MQRGTIQEDSQETLYRVRSLILFVRLDKEKEKKQSENITLD